MKRMQIEYMHYFTSPHLICIYTQERPLKGRQQKKKSRRGVIVYQNGTLLLLLYEGFLILIYINKLYEEYELSHGYMHF